MEECKNIKKFKLFHITPNLKDILREGILLKHTSLESSMWAWEDILYNEPILLQKMNENYENGMVKPIIHATENPQDILDLFKGETQLFVLGIKPECENYFNIRPNRRNKPNDEYYSTLDIPNSCICYLSNYE